jgi:hypothetical protein
MSLELIKGDDKPNPVVTIETRPSSFTGFAWWVVLTYKHHRFEEMLPFETAGMDDDKRDAAVAKVLPRLQAQLRPILEAEDA